MRVMKTVKKKTKNDEEGIYKSSNWKRTIKCLPLGRSSSK